MLKLLFEFFIKPEYLNDFILSLKKLQTTVRNKEGCLCYDIIIYKRHVFILELWASQAVFDAHQSSEELLEFRKKTNQYQSTTRKKHNLV